MIHRKKDQVKTKKKELFPNFLMSNQICHSIFLLNSRRKGRIVIRRYFTALRAIMLPYGTSANITLSPMPPASTFGR
jgi:hypothetical protein